MSDQNFDYKRRMLFESLPIKVKNEILQSGEDISTIENLNAVVMHHLYELKPEQRDEVMNSIHSVNKEKGFFGMHN